MGRIKAKPARTHENGVKYVENRKHIQNSRMTVYEGGIIQPERRNEELPPRKQHAVNQNATDDAVTDIIKTKQKRNRPDLAKFGEENTEPGDNTRYLRMARVSLSLPPIDISDASQVENRINQYFDFCEQNDRKPNMIGMANWLGVDRATVNSWKTGEYRTKTHLPVIKKAVDILEELWVDYMMNGKVNPGSGIFIGKNLFQYKDVQDVVVTPNNPYDTTSESELSDKYLTGSVKAEE